MSGKAEKAKKTTKTPKEKKDIKAKAASYAKDLIFYILGAIIYAFAIDMFTSPNNIAPGGITGLATIVNYLTDLPIGATMLVMNIPVFIIAGFIIGWEYIIRSGICLGISSVTLDLLGPIIPEYSGEPVLAAVFGGVGMGIALALIFMRGGSTGGTDIVARIVQKFFPHMTTGNLILAIDAMVVLFAGFIYGLEAALISIITVFVSTLAIDKVLYGLDNGKLMYIITSNIEEVNAAINKKLERGTTIMKARGGYSGAEREVIMCAIRRNEAYKIRELVRAVDPAAFIIVSDATEILGEGFRSITENEFGEEQK